MIPATPFTAGSAHNLEGARMTTGAEWRRDPTGWPTQPGLVTRLQIPRYRFRISGRQRLLDLVDRATHRRTTLLCAPADAGKTVACAAWAAARASAHQVVWVTLQSEEDQTWLWAYLCSGLRLTSAIPDEATYLLENGSAPAFPVRLVGMAWGFRQPVVIVLDNMDFLTDSELLSGLDFLARHAPPALRLVLCARQPPDMHLDRLRASGDLAEIGAADLAAATADTPRAWALRMPAPVMAGHLERLPTA
jgi:LuxR family transcriptional regulator, maltose regulon positive regulatory protein